MLLRLAEADERTQINRVKTLSAVAQANNAALLIDGHAELVARSGADGAHMTGIEAVTDALGSLKPDWIVGASGLTTRHDAMEAAEGGADYVMFGEPDEHGNARASKRSKSALAGGRKCSKRHALPMPPASMKLPRWFWPAPTLSRSATGCGAIPALSA